jgi:adenylosuccinate synthase
MFDSKTRTIVVVGAQWGDEGKGKLVDVLSERADWVVRYQGGANAGHTVQIGEKSFVLHQIPSGILHPGVRCAIGNGVVLDVETLFAEIDELVSDGIDVEGRLYVSDRAHLVMPYHKLIDAQSSASKEIGTTGRGIGPAYEDKYGRRGIRVLDLRNPERLRKLIERGVAHANIELATSGTKRADADYTLELLGRFAKRLLPLAEDVGLRIHRAIVGGAAVLLEGAQGSLLDIDHGTYPYVTSSNTTAGGACTGTGVPPHRIDQVVGVMKAYTTRVGEGALPTEDMQLANMLHNLGREFGATTGRKRRCGWFDAVATRYARMINGIDELTITNLDGLDHVDPIRVCVAYRLNGKRLSVPPCDARQLANCEPIYTDVRGWNTPTHSARTFSQLPPAARKYVRYISELTGAKLSMISVGPARGETIIL